MDEEEDDFYDPVDAVPTAQLQNPPQNAAQDGNFTENDDEIEEEEEDDVRTLLTNRHFCLPLTVCLG
jgi:pre-mRNA 3'-end-processing factor FIP1